ncbi:GNAT family N-acetyltransferase [Spiroplasma floricola]|uniref:GNAT family N-acetyltransferase n=1 Tax=Spiroplasma floricola 23-6 TaxID=1336749 RepID=A0A2K8SD59_9MOLU|nr:GNAT family N-acetyltransferase [Spiroplasma floricola]AUB31404.1 GNAT family N-acetyltransferase [Spiroplasma floricola 23-6]
MKLKYNHKISNNNKYDLIATTYLSYFVDPVYNHFNRIKLDNFEILECDNHSNAIVTSNWNYKENFSRELKKYEPKYLINFTEKAYNNQPLENIKFKGNYKFMELNLNKIKRFSNYEIKNTEFLKLENKKELDSFVKIIAEVFSDEVSDSNKFYGIFDEYQQISELFVVKYNNEIVGTGHLTHFDNKCTIVDDIAISEKARGKGIATFLMKSLINWSMEKNQNELYLFGSDDAFNIYKKLGFKEDKFWLEQFQFNY